MSNYLTGSIRAVLNFFGYEIIKLKYNPSHKDVNKWLRLLEINEILDIGANEGQSALKYHHLLPGKKIYAFEPIKSCFDKLVKNTGHLNIEHFNCGLGARDGVEKINISKNFVSSSILSGETLLNDLYPDAAYTSVEEIQIRSLDSVMKDKLDPAKHLLVKIDVQGYEEQVVKGGTDTLTKASAIIIESSFRGLYGGQWMFHDVYDFFTRNGFTFLGLHDQAQSKTNGIPVYCDAIFVKNELVPLLYDHQ